MLSVSSKYAIRATIVLAGLPEDAYMGAVDVARTITSPTNYVGKLLSALSGRGLLASRNGRGGGYRLARPAREISLLDVVTAVESLDGWNRCLLELSDCNAADPCGLHAEFEAVRSAQLALLRRTTLADILERSSYQYGP